MPDWAENVRSRLSTLRLAAAREVEVVEELSQHLDDRWRELIASGVSPEEATRLVLADFREGNLLARLMAPLRQANVPAPMVPGAPGVNFFSDFWKDIRYAARMLGKRPGFSAIGVLTLALGIGATTAIFSVVNAVLLRPLPYEDPSRLVWIHDGMTPNDTEGWPSCMADFLLWRERAHSFSRLAAMDFDFYALAGAGDAENVAGARVTAQFFDTLGIRPIRGRSFAPDADRPGQPPVALISERLWRRKFAAKEDTVGKVISVNGRPTTMIGILPNVPILQPDADIWSILPLNPPSRRGPFFLRAVARVSPSVSLVQARAELDALGREVERADPLKLDHARYPVVPLQQQVVGKARPLLVILSGAVCLVLLIAVFNVANLLLAQATARRREMAVRLGMGASRGRLVRQLIAESLVLALTGGVVGLGLAYATVAVLRVTSPPGLPRLNAIAVDARVLLMTLTVSVASGVFFGLAPAFFSARDSLNDALKEGGRGGTESGAARRLRDVLVVAELALSLILLVGAGLLIRSFVRLEGEPMGFLTPPDHLLAMEVSPVGARYRDSGASKQYWRKVLERVRGVPGVADSAVTITMPPDRTAFTDSFEIRGRTPADGGPAVPVPFVSPGYFATLGIPLLRGRDFVEGEEVGSTPVAIISDTMARHYFPGENPVGKLLKHGGPHQNNPWRLIVGVVGDVKYSGLDHADEPVYYEPGELSGMPMWLVVRTHAAAAALAEAVAAQVRSVDAEVPVSEIGPMSRTLSDSLELERFRLFLMGGFAFVALQLACIGLYGAIACYVAQRKHEIGIRMALGATAGGVMRLVVGRAFRLAAFGVVVGMLGVSVLVRFVKSMLFGIQPLDPLTLVAVALLLTCVAAFSAWRPARRASRIDPTVALREG